MVPRRQGTAIKPHPRPIGAIAKLISRDRGPDADGGQRRGKSLGEEAQSLREEAHSHSLTQKLKTVSDSCQNPWKNFQIWNVDCWPRFLCHDTIRAAIRMECSSG